MFINKHIILAKNSPENRPTRSKNKYQKFKQH
ncbi:MAG: hypothetical protein ACI8O8_000893, partial [Oleiphilaceae bacterium]